MSPGAADRVKVKVDKGWVKLTGDVYGDFQRRAAERAVRNLPGVRGVSNLIAYHGTGRASRRQAEDRGDAAA